MSANFMGNIWIEKRLVKAELVSLAAVDPEALVRVSEESYESGLENAARDILCRKSKVVLLSGASGCGKTTSANKLAGYLRKMHCPAQVISMDDFYQDESSYDKLPDGSYDYESVTCLDLPLIRQCLSEVLETGKTILPRFDFIRHCRAEETTALDIGSGVVIVEGIHALNPLITQGVEKALIYKIFAGIREEYADQGGTCILNAQDIRLGRRCLRDVQRGYSPEETLLRAESVNRGENLYIRPFKKEADCIVDTSFTYEPCVMAAALPAELRKISVDSPAYRDAQRLAAAWEQFRPMADSFCPETSMLREFIVYKEKAE